MTLHRRREEATLAAIEIERKFLVTNDTWRQGATPTLYRQGYLCSDETRTVRARIAADKAYLTIKSATSGVSRAEFEYQIPLPDANYILDNLCGRPVIEKNRHLVQHRGMTWEIDEFLGENAGLIIAEIELPSEDHPFDLPPWAGLEVSSDKRYYNSYLAQHPYTQWPEQTGANPAPAGGI